MLHNDNEVIQVDPVGLIIVLSAALTGLIAYFVAPAIGIIDAYSFAMACAIFFPVVWCGAAIPIMIGFSVLYGIGALLYYGAWGCWELGSIGYNASAPYLQIISNYIAVSLQSLGNSLSNFFRPHHSGIEPTDAAPSDESVISSSFTDIQNSMPEINREATQADIVPSEGREAIEGLAVSPSAPLMEEEPNEVYPAFGIPQ